MENNLLDEIIDGLRTKVKWQIDDRIYQILISSLAKEIESACSDIEQKFIWDELDYGVWDCVTDRLIDLIKQKIENERN